MFETLLSWFESNQQAILPIITGFGGVYFGHFLNQQTSQSLKEAEYINHLRNVVHILEHQSLTLKRYLESKDVCILQNIWRLTKDDIFKLSRMKDKQKDLIESIVNQLVQNEGRFDELHSDSKALMSIREEIWVKHKGMPQYSYEQIKTDRGMQEAGPERISVVRTMRHETYASVSIHSFTTLSFIYSLVDLTGSTK